MFIICNIILASCNLEVDPAAVSVLTTGGKCVEQKSYKNCWETNSVFGKFTEKAFLRVPKLIYGLEQLEHSSTEAILKFW